MNNIYLVGMMGCGKTTIGRLLAQKTQYAFVDLDELIEHREDRTISNIFASEGEGYFRNVERDVLGEISEKDEQIVSCGGGIILDRRNIQTMQHTGKIIYVERDPEATIQTIDTSGRPLLKDLSAFQKIYRERQPLYEICCTFKVRNEDIVDTVDAILSELGIHV